MNNQKTRGDQYTGKLHIGQLVHCILYGGQDGYISKIDGEQKPETIRTLGGGCGLTGGNANVSVHFATGHDSQVPEAIIRGVQWYIGAEPLSDEIVADCIIQAIEIDTEYNLAVKQRLEAKEAEAKARTEQMENLPKQYHFLETVKAYEQRTGKTYCSRVCAAQNIRRELAKEFQGIKFSVTSSIFSGGNDINISWTDGPTTKEIDDIVNKYNDHATDYTGDFRDPTNEVFNSLYGGAKYVMTNRRMSKETEEAMRPWADEQFKLETCFAKDSCGKENLIWRLVSAYSIPASQQVIGVKHIDGVMTGCGVSEFYELVTK